MNSDPSPHALLKNIISFKDLFEVPYLQRLQDLFAKATGVASQITDPGGVAITQPSNFCKLCQVVRRTEKGLSNCRQSDTQNCHNISGGIQLRSCSSAGLLSTGVKISVNGIHLANWLVGQVRNEGTDLEKLQAYGEEIGADLQEYQEALDQVPFMSNEKLQMVFDMLFVIANEISEKAYNNMLLKMQVIESGKINELLQKNKETLSITLHSIGDGVISTDQNGLIVDMNPVAEKLCGWKLTEASGHSFSEVFRIFDSQTRQETENPVKKVLESGKIIGLGNHTVLLSKDGTEYQIADSAAPIMNNGGEISGVVLVFSDVTEKYNAQEKIRQSEKRYKGLLNNLNSGVVVHAPDTSIVLNNPRASELLGLSGEAMRGKTASDRQWKFIDEYNNPLSLKDYPVNKIIATQKALNNMILGVIRDDSDNIVWLLTNGFPIYSEQGVLVEIIISFTDISDRKNAEVILENERLMLRTLIDNLPDTIYAKDLDGKKILANKAEVGMLGAESESEVIGKDDSHFYPKEYADRFRDNDQQVIQTGIPDLNQEGFIIDGKGKKHWLLSSKLPLRNKDNEIIGVMGIGRNIGARKMAEEALKKSEQFLKETQIIAQLGTYSLDTHTSEWTSSEVLDAIFGIEPDYQKTYDGWQAILHPDWRNTINDYMTYEVVGKREKFDKTYKIIRGNDQEERWVHGLGEIVFDQDLQTEFLIGTIRDITDQVNAEDALRESEEKYRNIFNNVQDIFYQLDMTGKIIDISPSIKPLSGYSREEIIGTLSENFYTNPGSRDLILEELSRKGEVRDYEVELKTKSGMIRNLSVNARLVLDSEGKPSHVDGALRDITKRKVTELALLNSEKKFRDYIEHAPHGVFVSDEKGNCLEVNSEAFKITGYSKEELCQKNLMDFISEESTEAFTSHLRKVCTTGFATSEFRTVRKDNTGGYISIDTVKLTEQLYLSFVIDITYRKIADHELKENADFLKKTQLIANLGNCMVDFSTGSWRSSDILDSILGIESGSHKTLPGIASVIHPGWRKELKEHFARDVVGKRAKFDKRFKIIRPVDQEERWVHAIGELKFDNENKPAKLIATVQDITERQQTTDALKHSEELHRSILNASPNAIVVVEMDGRIRMVSPAAIILYGCVHTSQLMGRNMFEFFIPKDRERARSNNQRILEGYLGAIEYQILRLDGTPIHAEVNGEIIWTDEHQPNGMVFIIRDITERKKSEDALKNSQLELKKFASHLQSVREEEKIQLAREIHDELGQILIAIKIDLGMMKQNVIKSIKKTDADKILTNFENLFGLVDNTLNTTRKIMTDLRPEVLYLVGFVEAVKLYVNNFKERHQLPCIFENTVTDLKLESQQSVALYRILQESLTNIVKHAKATEIKIYLRLKEGVLIMEVIDNGTGFNSSLKNKPNSYGLLGMKERVYLLEGELFILSQPGEGTTVKVEIPYLPN